MSSITGSCESPANTLFQQGIDKTQEKLLTEDNQEKKAIEQSLQISSSKSNAENNNSSNPSEQHHKQPQGLDPALDQGVVGRLIDTYA